MRELAILTFVTLDGVSEFTNGWAEPHWENVMEQVEREAMSAPYDVLLGRKTYDSFAAYFPSLGEDHPMNKATKYVAIMNKATKYVATSNPNELEWKNSKGISGDVVAEISRLKKQDGPLIQVHGSSQLIQTLLSHDLVDEFRLWTFPVLVGTGKRLFGKGVLPMPLELVKSETGPSGVTMSIYRRSIEK